MQDHELGVRCSTALRAAAASPMAEGSLLVTEMLTRAELYDLIGYQDYVDFDAGLKKGDRR